MTTPITLTVLGCAGGYPGPGAACSGYLLTTSGARIWIDTGTGSLPELLRHTDLHDLTAIWVSHLHADHCSDLTAAFHRLAYGPGRSGRLPLYGPPGITAAIDPLIDEPGGLAEVFAVTELTDRAEFDSGPFRLRAFSVPHSIDTFGLTATSGGRTLAYSSDCGPGDAVVDLARDADLFLCEAYSPPDAPARFTSVKTPADAGRIATEAGAHRLLLTHLGHDTDPGTAVRAATRQYPGPVGTVRAGATYRV